MNRRSASPYHSHATPQQASEPRLTEVTCLSASSVGNTQGRTTDEDLHPSKLIRIWLRICSWSTSPSSNNNCIGLTSAVQSPKRSLLPDSCPYQPRSTKLVLPAHFPRWDTTTYMPHRTGNLCPIKSATFSSDKQYWSQEMEMPTPLHTGNSHRGSRQQGRKTKFSTERRCTLSIYPAVQFQQALVTRLPDSVPQPLCICQLHKRSCKIGGGVGLCLA